MTREEIKQICQIYDNLRVERDAATIAYNSDDAFWEHVLATYKLSQPSLPSNLDKAAEKYAKAISVKVWGKIDPEKDIEGCISRANYGTGLLDGFKAGAEWMAEQGISCEAEAVKDVGISFLKEPFEKATKEFDGKVIVQIRKKEE